MPAPGPAVTQHAALPRAPALPPRARWPLMAGLLVSLLLVGASALILFERADRTAAVAVAGLALILGALWAWLLRAFLAGHARRAQLLCDMREQAARLQETRRIAGIGDWLWELDTGRVVWSEEVFDIYGLAPTSGGELRIEDIGPLMHPDDAVHMQGNIDNSLENNAEMFEDDFRIVRPDGEVRTVHARGEWIDRTPGRRVQRGIQQDITDLANARSRLRATQEEYEFLFQHNPLPMWVFERESLRFLAVNDSMLDSYGYAREELLAGSMLDIRPADEADAVRRAASVETDERPQGRVWTHLRKDGTRLRSAIHTRDIVFDGRPARLVLAEDVTERERSEERFQLIARATSDAVWDWDFAAGTTWRSDNIYALFGYAPGEFGSNLQAWEQLLHPDDRERVMTSVQHGIASGASEWTCDYRLRRKDGRYADVRDRGFILRDGHGHAVRAVGGMLDVTQARRDEADLRLLRRAVEATDNGIVIADARQPDFPVVYVNAAFEAITGYTAAEIQGHNCRLLQGRDRDQPGIEAIRAALQEQRETRVLLRNYRKDGGLFWNEVHLAPVADEHGTLTHFVGVLSDVSERQRYEDQLAYRATHDELTGLPNRQLLQDRLQQAILNAKRYGREVAVVFVDLDDFKLINDSLGHGAGDIALTTIATRLREVVRGTDTVGRFGGDEFVIVLTEQTDDAGMQQVLQRVTDALAQPIELAGVRHVLTPSIGHCRYPQAGQDAETLLKHADLAMYQAKRQGRNRAVAYRPEFDTAVSQRLQLVSRLREALHNGEFVLAFQPLFDGHGHPLALEALVRWQHPERGLLPPSEFIGVCEESGLIVDLGRFVLREAARHHALLAAVGLGHVRLSVNVSAAQFGHGLHTDVAATMRDFALPPGVLELEITESVIMDSPERAIETMKRISALGVGISVDDFGTGYSSLAYLKRLPIDRLKIDRSFVQDLGHDEDDAAICASIIGLGHLMDLRIVAEGVETQQQLDWLRERGCDELQGFLLARPAGFETILAMLVAGMQPTTARKAI